MSQVIVTLASTEKKYSFDKLSITFDTPERDVLVALTPVLLEDEGFNIQEEQAEGYYIVKKVENKETGEQNIYIFPKSPAGVL